MTDEKKSVLYSVEGAIARLTLNRPEKANALNDTVIDGLKQGLRQADSDKTMRVVVISGAGPDFVRSRLSALQKISGASVEENFGTMARALMETVCDDAKHALANYRRRAAAGHWLADADLRRPAILCLPRVPLVSVILK